MVWSNTWAGARTLCRPGMGKGKRMQHEVAPKSGTGTHGDVAGLDVQTRRLFSGNKPLLSFLSLSGRWCQQ